MKKLRLVLFSFLITLTFIYAFGVYFYSTHSYPSTFYNGNKYGDMTADEIYQKLNDTETTDIVLNEGSFQEIIPGKDINFRHNYEKDEVKVKNNSFLWPMEVLKKHSLQEMKYTSSYDENLLKKKILESDLLNKKVRVAPEDAKVVLGTDKWEVSDSKKGTMIDKDKLVSKVVESVNKRETQIDVVKMDPYMEAKVKKDDEKLKKEAEYKNRWGDTSIIIDLDGLKVPLIDYSTDSGLKINSEEGFAKNNEKKVQEFVEKLSEKYDSINLKRTFKNSYGDTITLDPGNFGYRLKKADLVAKINQQLTQGNKTEIKAAFSYKGKDIKNDQIKNDYIEIDISTQMLWLYKDGKKIHETPITTGNINISGRATPVGTWQVLSKESNRFLISTRPGDEYKVKVAYWMPFTTVGHGLHDAVWLSDIGGAYYKTNGSHGCVNLTLNSANFIFNNIKTGIPVVIYKSGREDTKTVGQMRAAKAKMKKVLEKEALQFASKLPRPASEKKVDKKQN